MDNWFINNETGRNEFQDARFYRDSRTGEMVPSVTTFLEAWPKGAAYHEWLKKHGADADEIRDEAGRRGSTVHNLTEQLDFGAEVRMCGEDGSPRYKMSEWAMLERYVDFRKAHAPRIIDIETNLVDSELGYAGTLDRVMELKDDVWIIDIKTSEKPWTPERIAIALAQLGAYAECTRWTYDVEVAGVGFVVALPDREAQVRLSGPKSFTVEDAVAAWHERRQQYREQQRSAR